MTSSGPGVRRLGLVPPALRYVALASFMIMVCMVLAVIMTSSPWRTYRAYIPAARNRRAQAETEIMSLQLAAEKGVQPRNSGGARPPVTEGEKRRARIPLYDRDDDLLFFSHIHKTSGTSLSDLLSRMFPREAVVPTSQPSGALKTQDLLGRNAKWWEPYKVMYGHNRPNVTDEFELPRTKRPRLLLVVRNPMLQKASIYYESVCHFGLHVKDGVVDREEATRARMEAPRGRMFAFCRDPEQWVGSAQFRIVYRNFQSVWLSHGGAERHPCIKPNLDMNYWDQDRRFGATSCRELQKQGLDEEIWEAFFDKSADAAIRRLEGALWVGVTERMEESSCLLFLTLGKSYQHMKNYRFKNPRPITMWNETSIDKALRLESADWKVFQAANDLLDLRLWTAREKLMVAEMEYRKHLGPCYDVIVGTSDGT